jgi:hypothetical protein
VALPQCRRSTTESRAQPRRRKRWNTCAGFAVLIGVGGVQVGAGTAGIIGTVGTAGIIGTIGTTGGITGTVGTVGTAGITGTIGTIGTIGTTAGDKRLSLQKPGFAAGLLFHAWYDFAADLIHPAACGL